MATKSIRLTEAEAAELREYLAVRLGDDGLATLASKLSDRGE